MAQKLQDIKHVVIPLAGGLDLNTPHAMVKPGMMVEGVNFDATISGGYRRLPGYERTAGGVTLREKLWYGLVLSSVTAITLNTTITDATTGATGYVIAKDVTNKVVLLVNVSGTFGIDNLLVTPSTVTIKSTLLEKGALDSTLLNTWQLASDNYYRALVGAVPGSGNVLGVWIYKDKYYAFRKNGTYVKLYVGNGTAWTEVPFFHILKFDAGVLADGDIVVGDTITGATSGATGIVKNFIKNAGSYGSTASGYMVISATGTFQNNEAIQRGGVTRCTADGANYAITFTSGNNKFQFINYNFYATSDYYRMYGCDGVNPAFEFDGTVLTPILLAAEANTPETNQPKYIEAHKNYLFLAFPSGSVQSSVLGEPLIWNGFLGAAEYGLGSEIKGMKSVMDNALIIATERDIQAIYGDVDTEFTKKIIAANTGCIDYTMAISIRPYILSQKGIIRVDPSQSFGNFESSSISRAVQPLMNSYIANKSIIGCGISRLYNHYKIYFSDGTGVLMTQDAMFADNQLPNFMTFQYFHAPTCMSSVNVDDTEEVLLFGDKDGYVYRENTNNNCDGEKMEYVLRTPFMHFGSPSIRKAFKRIEFEIDAEGGSDVRFSYEFSNGQSHTERSDTTYVTANGGGGYWNSSNWSEFYWASAIVDQQIHSITGTGHNISILFYGNSAITDPFLINSISLHYLPRRLNRG